MTPYDEYLLYDPAFREAVLYELEMLQPMPRLPERTTTGERYPLLPAPETERTTRIVDAHPPVRQYTSSLWILAIMVVIAFLLAYCVSNSLHQASTTKQSLAPAAKPTQANSISQFHSHGAYVVTGQPTISAAFIDQVLSAYHSPAAGTGQALYDLGVQYGIDPVFALAFFLHESSFGEQGMATTTLSLGNLRCIPNYPCINGYAGFGSWQQGYEEWYKLIRNLYVGQWHLTTVAQIIPTYAPSSDHNNVQGYIAAVEHTIDTWHAGKVFVQ